MQILIVRHGQTLANAAGIIQGHQDGQLSELGLSQIQKIAQRLKEYSIDYIYSSDLSRAAQTAQAIAAYHSSVPLAYTEKLRERNLGEIEGKTRQEIGVGPDCAIGLAFETQNGESISQMYQRAKQILAQIMQSHQRQSVLLVCHGGFGAGLIGALQSYAVQDLQTMPKLKNTSLSSYELAEGSQQPQTICFNCTKHLE